MLFYGFAAAGKLFFVKIDLKSISKYKYSLEIWFHVKLVNHKNPAPTSALHKKRLKSSIKRDYFVFPLDF